MEGIQLILEVRKSLQEVLFLISTVSSKMVEVEIGEVHLGSGKQSVCVDRRDLG